MNPNARLGTPLSAQINGSLARKALADLEANGQIKKVVGHSKLSIYTRAIGDAE